MERVHYRRIMPSRLPGRVENDEPERRRYGSPEEDTGARYEQWIVQGIVSGLILAVVLLTQLADNDLSLTVENGLRQALTGQTSAEGLLAEAQRLTTQWRGLAGTVDTPENYENPYMDTGTVSGSGTDSGTYTGSGGGMGSDTYTGSGTETDAVSGFGADMNVNESSGGVSDGGNIAEQSALTNTVQPAATLSEGDAAQYIDMDVLAELNARTASDDAVKSLVPEPSASPEP